MKLSEDQKYAHSQINHSQINNVAFLFSARGTVSYDVRGEGPGAALRLFLRGLQATVMGSDRRRDPGNRFFFLVYSRLLLIDEAIYFTDDPAIVNSFKTKYDDLWTDTTSYGNYANITTPLARRYPTFPIDPEMNFPPSVDDSQDFYNRTALEMNQEPRKIVIIMYRITNDRYTNTSINAVNRGIPVRLLTEQNEYRNPDRPWDAYNVDLLYNGGVQIRIRAHQGLNHEKVVMLYGLGETIFGSSNWTGPSSNSQQENNYFTKKQW